MTLSAPIVLHSPRLKIEIAAPGTAYRRSRFDWTGFVTQVTLDNRHTFCVPEDYDPQKGSGGIGLCSEFGIEKIFGYADAQPGELFPKPGIGLLRKPDNTPYNFFYPYEIAQPFPIQVDCTADTARFTVEPVSCRGYAARQIRTLRVAGNRLQMTCQLENTGSRPIHTHEYTHNFLGVNNRLLGPDYCLRFPYPVTLEPGAVNTGIMKIAGKTMRWTETPKEPFYCRPLGYQKTCEPQWELTVEQDGLTMREYDDFAPARVAVWGTTHVVSAEVFIDLNLEPGESKTWTRTFEWMSQA